MSCDEGFPTSVKGVGKTLLFIFQDKEDLSYD